VHLNETAKETALRQIDAAILHLQLSCINRKQSSGDFEAVNGLRRAAGWRRNLCDSGSIYSINLRRSPPITEAAQASQDAACPAKKRRCKPRPASENRQRRMETLRHPFFRSRTRQSHMTRVLLIQIPGAMQLNVSSCLPRIPAKLSCSPQQTQSLAGDLGSDDWRHLRVARTLCCKRQFACLFEWRRGNGHMGQLRVVSNGFRRSYG